MHNIILKQVKNWIWKTRFFVNIFMHAKLAFMNFRFFDTFIPIINRHVTLSTLQATNNQTSIFSSKISIKTFFNTTNLFTSFQTIRVLLTKHYNVTWHPIQNLLSRLRSDNRPHRWIHTLVSSLIILLHSKWLMS